MGGSIKDRGIELTKNKRLWDGIDLTPDQHWHERDKPKDYIQLQIDLLNYINGNIIVEIGSVRLPMNHTLTDFNPLCCNDGHSTFFWANTNKEVHTVDIANLSHILHPLSQQFTKTFNAYVGDGITFLSEFSSKIDLLFLDAWDVIPGTPYAEKHLEAFEAAKGKLNKKHIIGIDDTDIGGGGKGRLLIPRLLDLNYTLVADGRQTILVNFDLNKQK